MATRPSTQVIPRGVLKVTQKLVSVSPKRVQLTAADMKDPATLQRTINDIYATLDEVTHAARALPFISGVWQKSVLLPSFGNTLITHGLGRPYLGYIITRVYNGLLGGGCLPEELLLNPGETPDRCLRLTNVNSVAATVDLFIF